MPERQRRTKWLTGWRAKRRLKRPRTVMNRLFDTVDGDSEEKIAQRHTSRGEELAAEDRRRVVKGSGGGLM